jgi:hypothetical protein
MTPLEIYNASDAEATKALYARLEQYGPIGLVGLNLFRAQKASARAKVYRGGIPGRGSYRRLAYERKQWSLENLCQVLADHAAELGLRWGWKEDPMQPYNPWVLYVDLPAGQVSFHSPARGLGPDYPADWDRVPDASPFRIIRWVDQLLTLSPPAPTQRPVGTLPLFATE